MRIVIGSIIIVIGVALMATVVYIVFVEKTPVSEMLDKIPTPTRVTDNVENKSVDNAPKDSGQPTTIDNTQNKTNEPRRIVVVEDEKRDSGEKVTSGELNKNDLLRMAASFAERFGSYSNQSNFANIVDLRIFMSQKMKKWADNYVEDERSLKTNNDIYYGIITKSIAKELLEYDDDIGLARVKVITRRREATVTTGNLTNVFDQNVIIEFVKENGVWKVDSARWEPQS